MVRRMLSKGCAAATALASARAHREFVELHGEIDLALLPETGALSTIGAGKVPFAIRR